MERPYLCPDCGLEHDEPADARLGHLVPCVDCSMTSVFERHAAEVPEPIPAIAA